MRKLLRALIRPGDNKLFSKAMSAGFWAGSLRATLRATMLIRTVILARLLVPNDFGLMAIATISILFVERLTESGVYAALVQEKGDVGEYLDTAWTMQIVRSVFISVFLVVVAPLVATFFAAPETEAMLRVLAISVLVKGFTNPGVILFIKELRFDRQFVLELVGRGTDVVVSIALAFILRSVWALVFGILIGAVARVVASYLIDSYRPHPRWEWEQVKHLFDFGKWVLVGNFLGFASHNVDDIIVGRYLGVASLGQYRMAYNFSQAVSTEITGVANQVAFPTYSKLQGSVDRLRLAYMGTLHFVAFLGFPIAVGTVLVAPDLVRGLLGEQWESAIVPMQLLSMAQLFGAIGTTTWPLFLSQGGPSIPPRFTAARLVMLAILLPPAVGAMGINGAALAVGVTAILVGTSSIVVAFRWVQARGQQIRQALLFPAVNTTVMAILVLTVGLLVPSDSNVVSLVLSVVVGVGGYFASVFASTKMLHYHAPGDLVGRIQRATLD